MGSVLTLGSGNVEVGGGPQNGFLGDTEILASNANGELLAGWIEIVDGGCGLILDTSFFDPTTQAWSTPSPAVPDMPFTAATDFICPGPSFALALSDDGDALAAWPMSFNAPTNSVALEAANYSAQSGSWAAPTTIVTAASTLAFKQGLLSVALNSAGNGWIVFPGNITGCAGAQRAVGLSYSPTAGYGQPVTIDGAPLCGGCPSVTEQPTIGDGIFVVALSDGTFVSAWDQVDTTNACANPTEAAQLAGARGTAAAWGSAFALPVQVPPDLVTYPTIVRLAAAGTDVVAGWQSLGATDAGVGTFPLVLTVLRAGDVSWETGADGGQGPQTLPVQAYGIDDIDIALNGGGQGVVSWLSEVSLDDAGVLPRTVDAYAAPLGPGLALGAPIDLSAACGNFGLGSDYTAEMATAAINPDGGIAAVWSVEGVDGPFIGAGATYSTAGGWAPCVELDNDAGLLLDPIVADVGGGQWGVLYLEGQTNASILFSTGEP